ncbi:MAG: hypothetical protein JNJ71_10475 [Rubrivivax sp.]|nr:hypothetical protein [Rubrivivax sp.]
MLSWLLVAVLAVDLVTSPLHAHRHDGEWSVGGALSAPADHPGDVLDADHDDVLAHIDAHEATGISHSIAALRSAAESTATEPAPDESLATFVAWLIPALWAPGPAPAVVWPPDRQGAGSSVFKSLPPHGRAPPLHA